MRAIRKVVYVCPKDNERSIWAIVPEEGHAPRICQVPKAEALAEVRVQDSER